MLGLGILRALLLGMLALGGLTAVSGAQAAPQGPLDPCAAVTCATLSVVHSGNGSGTVTSSPAGINCTITAGVASGICSKTFAGSLVGGFNPITVVTTWVASSGSAAFGGVLGPVPMFTFTIGLIDGDNREAIGAFKLTHHLLSVSRSGVGTGTVKSQPAGIDCGATCSKEIDYGTHLTLTATPDAGAVFKQWTGACNGQDATCDLTITQATSTNAVFDLPGPTGGQQADTTVDVDVVGAKGTKSRIGKRIIQLELLLDENVSATLTLTRGDTTLATKEIQRVKEGDRVLALPVPGNVSKGKAKLTFELTDAAGNTFSATRNVKIPKK